MQPTARSTERVTRWFCYAVAIAAAVVFLRKCLAWSVVPGTADRVLGVSLPVLLGVLSLGVSRQPVARRLAFLVVTLALGSALAAAEISLAVLREVGRLRVERHPSWPYLEAARQRGLPVDERTLGEIVRDERQAGRRLSPYVVPAFWARSQIEAGREPGPLFPLGSVSRARAVLGNETGMPVIDETDEHGFRNRAGKWAEKSFSLSLLGDSFAHGCCVPFEESPSGQLEKLIPDSINLAMAGNGPLRELATLKEYGPVLAPKTIAWVFFEGNDWSDLEAELGISTLKAYLSSEHAQRLIERQQEIDALLGEFGERWLERALARPSLGHELFARIGKASWWADRLHLALLRKEVGLAVRAPNVEGPAAPDAKALASVLQSVLESARATAARWGGTLFFVYVPQWNWVRKDETPLRAAELALGAARAAGLDLVDLRPILKAHPKPETLYTLDMQAHFSAEGYRVLVGEIARKSREATARP